MCSSERCRSFLAGFGLVTSDAGVFCRTQWKFPWILWAVYRMIITVSYTVYAVFVFGYDDHVYSFKYLSNWALWVVTVYFIIATVNLFMDRKHGRVYHYATKIDLPTIDLSWRHKVQWIVMNCFINTSILVTIIYWGAFGVGFATDPLGISYDLFEHIFPLLIAVFEIIMTPIPVRLQHLIHPAIFLYTYIFVTIIFYYGDPNTGAIYSILDYGDAGSATITILGCTVLSLVLQVFAWGLYRCKLIVARRLTRSSAEASPAIQMSSSAETNVVVDGKPSHEIHVDEVNVQDEGIQETV